MEIVKDLVVTNVTPVKLGKYGGFRVTINCYEKVHPVAGDDTIYFVSIPLNSPSLASLYDQLEITDDIDRKVPGQRLRLPSGIRINVACSEIKSDSVNKRIKFISNVISIELVEVIRSSVDVTFKASEITFSDWGITMMTKDGVYTEDKYVFYNDDMSFKSSSLIEHIKENFPGDHVRLKGKARIFYATYKEKGSWKVKAKHRFDSRFDEMIYLVPEFHLDSITIAYVKKLKEMRSSPGFKSLLVDMGESWKDKFITEKEILDMGRERGVELDPVIVSKTFLVDHALDVYMYLKSLLTDIYEIYYYQKSADFKYVFFHDMASRKGVDYGQVAKQQKLVVYDVKMGNIYVFSCKEGKVAEMAREIVENATVLFVDRLMAKTRDFGLIDMIKVNEKMELNEWLEPVSEALFAF